MSMVFPLTMAYRPSRYLQTLWFLVFAASASALAATHWSWPWKLLALAALMLAGVASFRQLRLRLRVAGSLRLHTDGTLQLGRRPEELAQAERYRPLPGPTVHPWLTVLRWRDAEGRQQSLLVLPDSMPEDDFRRLRIWLRWPHGQAYKASAEDDER